MRSYEERAKDFIKEVFPFIQDFESPFTTRANIRTFNARFTRNVKVACGCARIALITSDYVVKYDYDPSEVECIGGCDNELELFYYAKREGFDYLFAEITAYNYKDRNFYIMPRIRGIGSSEYYAEHYMTNAEKDFCRRYRVTDLHSHNYGFRKGKVCIVDYACHLSYETNYDEYYYNRTSPQDESWR